MGLDVYGGEPSQQPQLLLLVIVSLFMRLDLEYSLIQSDPWFGTYNFLSEKIPIPHDLVPRLFVCLTITLRRHANGSTEAGVHWIRRISGLGYSQQQLESRQDL
jgi:hypothetical protein